MSSFCVRIEIPDSSTAAGLGYGARVITRARMLLSLETDPFSPGRKKLKSREGWRVAATAVELTPDDLREIDQAAPEIEVQGAPYPEKLEAMTGR